MKKGTIWMSLGLLLITAALFLTGYNIWQDKKAQTESEQVVNELIQELKLQTDTGNGGDAPLQLEMPDVEINGEKYIGVLQIPACGLELPVMGTWSYPQLRIAPCRYKGSVYTRDLIIAGHNYNSHFGKLKNLVLGESIYFWDVKGNVFQYEVSVIEELGGTAVEEMEAGNWDLTLFTCTYGGRTRVTIRCNEII